MVSEIVLPAGQGDELGYVLVYGYLFWGLLALRQVFLEGRVCQLLVLGSPPQAHQKLPSTYTQDIVLALEPRHNVPDNLLPPAHNLEIGLGVTNRGNLIEQHLDAKLAVLLQETHQRIECQAGNGVQAGQVPIFGVHQQIRNQLVVRAGTQFLVLLDDVLGTLLQHVCVGPLELGELHRVVLPEAVLLDQ